MIRRYIERRRDAIEVEKEDGAGSEKIPIAIIKSISIYKGNRPPKKLVKHLSPLVAHAPHTGTTLRPTRSKHHP